MTRIQGIPDLGDGVRLHLNENTGGCSQKVVDAVRAFDARSLATYPDYRAAVTETARVSGRRPGLAGAHQRAGRGRPARPRLPISARAPRRRWCRTAPRSWCHADSRKWWRRCLRSRPTSPRPKRWARESPACRPDPTTRFRSTVCCERSPRTRGSSTSTTRTTRAAQPVSKEAIRARGARGRSRAGVLDEAYHDFMGENFLEEALSHPERARRAHVLEGVRPGRHAHRRDDRAAGHPRADSPGDATLQPERRRRVRVCARRLRTTQFKPWYLAQAAESKQLIYDALDRVGLRYWTERRQLRARRRRRAVPRAGRRSDRARRARARSLEGSGDAELLPHHHRGRRAHARGGAGAGGPMRRAVIDRRTAETRIRRVPERRRQGPVRE